jgi:hypothetical protein
MAASKLRSQGKGKSMFEYKGVSISTAFIAMTLCLVLLLAPEILFSLFSIQENSSAFFIGRRAAMLFLGISIFSWVGRNAVNSESRQAICLGLAISMFTLALLGSAEFIRGYAGIGILLAIITEFILATLYFQIWFRYKNAIRQV